MIEQPKITKETGPIGGERLTHPAYAAISASRVSGETVLFGSDFVHRQFVRIAIYPSEIMRSGGRDSHHPESTPLVEVSLSEAQWATFVSSMNVGSGVPCTLTRANGAAVADLPAPVDRRGLFKNSAIERLDLAMNALNEMRDLLRETSLSKKAKDELQNKIDSVERQITQNLPYVAEQFDKHMETTTERAKIEINAFALSTVIRAGMGQVENMSADTVFKLEK